jgi:hypothetical protein
LLTVMVPGQLIDLGDLPQELRTPPADRMLAHGDAPVHEKLVNAFEAEISPLG